MKKYYHCSSLDEPGPNIDDYYTTLCGISTKHESWDFPYDFAECDVGPAYGYEKCKICVDHPDMPMALLGDLEEP